MFVRFIVRMFFCLLVGLQFLLIVISCTQDHSDLSVDSPSSGIGITDISLKIHIPDFREVGTRTPDDFKINSLTVLFFADEGKVEQVKVKKFFSYQDIQTVSYQDGNMFLSFPVTAGRYTRIALVANAEFELSSITLGSTYEALQSLQAFDKFNASYIPMYGEYAPIGGITVQSGVSNVFTEIFLFRMLARIDVINQIGSGAKLTNSVHYVNPSKGGVIFVNPSLYNAGYTTPTLPATLLRANGGNALTASVPFGSSSVTYYLPEQPVTSTVLSTDGMNRPCVVVEMEYGGRVYYYRLDYTWDGVKNGGDKGNYMPVLRNHRYIFTIKEVKGPGFLSLNDALKSPENHTNLNNIVVAPFVIDEGFTDVVYNSSGFLAVTRTSMRLSGKHDSTSSDNFFSVRTSYGEGWKVEAYNADGTLVGSLDPWLQSSLSFGVANHTATIQALTNGNGFKDGYLEVCAGRLYAKVNVSQILKLPLEYVAKYSLAGGYSYGSSFSSSSPSGVLPTGAQTDVNLRWAINHSNDQSGYYNWYVCKGIVDLTYNPSGKNLFTDSFFTTGAGKGYHLPSNQELTGVFSYVLRGVYENATSISNVNEAIEFGGNKNTYSSDYYSKGDHICYALRFKKGTNAPNDGSSLSDFPKAPDDKMACAYRYRRFGSFLRNNNLDSQLEIQCVYVGDQFPLPDLQTVIAEDAWWNAQISVPGRVVTRTFPAAGCVLAAIPSSASGSLADRGYYGNYWSLADYGFFEAWYAVFQGDNVINHFNYNKRFGFSVRPFLDQ